MAQPKDLVEVQELPAETSVEKLLYLIKEIREYAALPQNQDPQKALRLIAMDVGSVVKILAPFDSFPTKKARFKVFPQSEEKLERVAKALGIKTRRDAIDAVLEFLLNRLPEPYWERKSDVFALLGEHLPSSGDATPVSLSMNSLGYALLQDLAETLEQSQGAVLEAAIALWLTELGNERAKTMQAGKILDEFHSQALSVETQLGEIFGPGPHIFGDESPICRRFGFVMVDLENLRSAIEANINEGVPIA
jgi:hypothetical protein